MSPQSLRRTSRQTIRCPDFLHTNGCGDFTLIAREHWFDLRGYPEFDVFSMNIDSVFCFAAHYGGAREEVLADPMRIYHIEHGSGSGWTPEGQQKLFERIAAKGIPIIDNEEVLEWGAQMRRLDSPMIFNHEDWGLAGFNLDETTPGSGQITSGQARTIGLDATVLPSVRALAPELRDYTEVHQAGPEIEAGLLSAGRALAHARPLIPYPGWRFDSDWDSSDIQFRMRRFIWTYFHNQGRETPLRMNWHKELAIQIHLGNDLSRPIFVGGCIEPNEFAFLDSILKPGMVFVDAGANEGLYSLFASRCVGPSGRVFAFEPSQREFQRLICNIQINGLENVRAVPARLAEAPGGLERNMEDAGVARLDVLRLGMEGSELRVLDDSRKVLREMRPIILSAASSGVIEFLRSQDYRIYAFDDQTGTPIPQDAETRSDNMIAVPAERPAIKEKRTKPKCHLALDSLAPYEGAEEPGFSIDFLGIRTRREFSAGAAIAAMPVHTTGPHEDYFEWIDLVESIMAAKDQYTMMELGAGYGRWAVRAAALSRKLRQLPFQLVAIEAEPRHYRWLQQHMSDNHIPHDARTLIQGVVSDHRDDVLFYVGSPSGESDEPASWYGQAIIQTYEAVDEARSGNYEGQDVVRLKSGWKSVKTRAYILTDILPKTDRIDLIDMDLQGEELKVISAAIEALDQRVARLHIGTHSHEIETGLRQLLSQHGWECKADYPCAQTNQTPWGPVQFVDGVQSWVNTTRFPVL